jgi:hypothetical protein
MDEEDELARPFTGPNVILLNIQFVALGPAKASLSCESHLTPI